VGVSRDGAYGRIRTRRLPEERALRNAWLRNVSASEEPAGYQQTSSVENTTLSIAPEPRRVTTALCTP
jgi:hypothetical protein